MSDDIDPKVRRFFPWALFLALALAFAVAATRVHAEEKSWDLDCYGAQRYQAMSEGWPECHAKLSYICERVQQYLAGHTPEEGKAEAKKRNVPDWLVRKAERCLQK